MPRVRTPDDTARRYLFGGNMSELARRTGIDRRKLYERKKRPGKMSLDEFAIIATKQGLAPDEVLRLIQERG